MFINRIYFAAALLIAALPAAALSPEEMALKCAKHFGEDRAAAHARKAIPLHHGAVPLVSYGSREAGNFKGIPKHIARDENPSGDLRGFAYGWRRATGWLYSSEFTYDMLLFPPIWAFMILLVFFGALLGIAAAITGASGPLDETGGNWEGGQAHQNEEAKPPAATRSPKNPRRGINVTVAVQT